MLFHDTLRLANVRHLHVSSINQLHDRFEVELRFATCLEHMNVSWRVVVGPEEKLEPIFAQDRGA